MWFKNCYFLYLEVSKLTDLGYWYLTRYNVYFYYVMIFAKVLDATEVLKHMHNENKPNAGFH